ncbi:ubiquitin carboxyl-terminal [Cyclospora cayetanensis]|uniref:Ubiquitin carboxyl-terminal n=1 Tax=Cyclospora cayetanensis TaxID=88456 RepID=A0A1D3CYX2_9EIME|nr:ubiquitin carboxyl-terminal [Cyclospora cayetanensis]
MSLETLQQQLQQSEERQWQLQRHLEVAQAAAEQLTLAHAEGVQRQEALQAEKAALQAELQQQQQHLQGATAGLEAATRRCLAAEEDNEALIRKLDRLAAALAARAAAEDTVAAKKTSTPSNRKGGEEGTQHLQDGALATPLPLLLAPLSDYPTVQGSAAAPAQGGPYQRKERAPPDLMRLRKHFLRASPLAAFSQVHHLLASPGCGRCHRGVDTQINGGSAALEGSACGSGLPSAAASAADRLQEALHGLECFISKTQYCRAEKQQLERMQLRSLPPLSPRPRAQQTTRSHSSYFCAAVSPPPDAAPRQGRRRQGQQMSLMASAPRQHVIAAPVFHAAAAASALDPCSSNSSEGDIPLLYSAVPCNPVEETTAIKTGASKGFDSVGGVSQHAPLVEGRIFPEEPTYPLAVQHNSMHLSQDRPAVAVAAEAVEKGSCRSRSPFESGKNAASIETASACNAEPSEAAEEGETADADSAPVAAMAAAQAVAECMRDARGGSPDLTARQISPTRAAGGIEASEERGLAPPRRHTLQAVCIPEIKQISQLSPQQCCFSDVVFAYNLRVGFSVPKDVHIECHPFSVYGMGEFKSGLWGRGCSSSKNGGSRDSRKAKEALQQQTDRAAYAVRLGNSSNGDGCSSATHASSNQ